MRVLIVEDDVNSVSDITRSLKDSAIADTAYSGNEGAYMVLVNEYDAILLDSTLPDIDSIDFCHEARSKNVRSPIMVLMDSENDIDYKVKSLDAGADDYIHKPIDTKELTAKIRALVRRKNGNDLSPKIVLGNIKVDTIEREVYVCGKKLDLRRKEYDLFEYLVQNRNRTVPKEEILEHIWESGIYIPSNTLEVHVNSLRKKLASKTKKKVIRTVRGFGYKLVS